MTPEEVLWALRELCLVSWAEYGRTEVLVDFDTTVLRFTLDLPDSEVMSWRDVARLLNLTFRVRIDLDIWRPVLTPMHKRTLLDVCRLIARVRSVPEVRPYVIFGLQCQVAGAFLSIREICRQGGVEIQDLRPSTPLGPFLRKHLSEIMVDLRLLAGPRTPCVELEMRARPLTAGLIAIRLLVAIALLMAFPLWFVAGWCAGSAGCLALFAYVCTEHHDLAAVRLGNLRDFRDLSYAICGQTPRPRRKRSAACPA